MPSSNELHHDSELHHEYRTVGVYRAENSLPPTYELHRSCVRHSTPCPGDKILDISTSHAFFEAPVP